MFKKKTEIHAVPTETATGLALKQSLEPITQITKSLKENRKSLIEEEMQTASQISDIQGSFDTILAQSDQVASGMDSIKQEFATKCTIYLTLFPHHSSAPDIHTSPKIQ